MEMRPGRESGSADIADDLSGRHGLSGREDGVRHVGIERLCAVAMGNDDIVAVAAVPATATPRYDDGAVRRGTNRRAARGANVDTIPAVEALRDATARYGGYILPALGFAPALVRLLDDARGAGKTWGGRNHYLASRDDNGRADDEQCPGI